MKKSIDLLLILITVVFVVSCGRSSGGNVVTLTFPVDDYAKTEFNTKVYAEEPFSVSLTLPNGWSVKKQEVVEDKFKLLPVFSKYNILKYTLGEYDYEIGAYPIIRVELPKPADREWFERSYEPIQTSAARTRSAVTMTLARARQFFTQFKNLSCATTLQCPCIPFQYAGDGCYARARYMRKLKA